LPNRLAALIAATVLVAAACQSSVPPSATVTATSPTNSSLSPTAPPDLTADLHELPAAYRPCSDIWNSGSELVWSNYDVRHASCPDIWRYVPGAAAPERVYQSQDRGVVLDPVVEGNGAYAFLERANQGGVDLGWKLWYVPSPGALRVLLAQGVSGEQAAATLTADDQRLVWAVFNQSAVQPASSADPLDATTSSLHVAPWSDLRSVETRLNLPMHEGLIWYPDLNGDELWYGIIHGDWTNAVQDDIRVQMINLGLAGSQPVTLPGVGREFNPAVNDDFIVYKRPDPGIAALNWGTIVVLDRRSHQTGDIAIDGNRPTIGTRFVTWETITRSRLDVYDPSSGRTYTLRTLDSGGIAGPTIHGDLLTFAQFPQDGSSTTIWWGRLPG
jgi:hypothetical protein